MQISAKANHHGELQNRRSRSPAERNNWLLNTDPEMQITPKGKLMNYFCLLLAYFETFYENSSAVRYRIGMNIGNVMRHMTVVVIISFWSKPKLQQHTILCEIRIPVCTPLASKPSAFRNVAKYLNSETNASMIALCP